MFAEKNLIKLEVYLSCAFCALVKSGDFCVLCTWRGIDKNSFPPGLTMKKRSFFSMYAPNIYLFRHDNHCPAAFLRGVDFLCVCGGGDRKHNPSREISQFRCAGQFFVTRPLKIGLYANVNTNVNTGMRPTPSGRISRVF